uniref:Interferon-induced protein 44-like isoform X1 n=2 Tax=Pogona vitticeps TaxID=103695 RepID=A0ABM5G8E9_9SAUR
MFNVQSRLTKEEKRSLSYLVGSKQFSLLYKGSVHGYDANAFHSMCNRQGPTVVVAYNGSGYIFGGFTVQSYTSCGRYLNDEKAFLFRLKGKDGELGPLKIPVKIANQAVCDYSHIGPNFGDNALLFLSQNSAAVATKFGSATYTFSAEDLHGNDQVLLECEVYRVEDGDMMKKPWREIDWTHGKRKELMNQIASYKPPLNSVQQVRVLFLGPVGAGKSSFFNSVNSVFRGYVTSQAIAGSDSGSVTLQYRTYQVKNGSNGKPLPIVFCDTMGLEEKQGAGLDMDDITNLLQGHIPERYQFNPTVAMQPDTLGYIKCPSLKDQIHCVVFVTDGSKMEILPEKLERKLRKTRQKINKLAVPQLVIMTKVDAVCPSHKEDLSDVYRSQAVMRQMEITAESLGIPLSQIVPVKNYCSELELKDDADILILMAVRQMLRLAESYFDNFPSDHTSKMDDYFEE